MKYEPRSHLFLFLDFLYDSKKDEERFCVDFT